MKHRKFWVETTPNATLYCCSFVMCSDMCPVDLAMYPLAVARAITNHFGIGLLRSDIPALYFDKDGNTPDVYKYYWALEVPNDETPGY